MRAAVAIAIAGLAAAGGCKRASSLYCDVNAPSCPDGYFCDSTDRVCVELVDGAIIRCDQAHPCSEPLPFCQDQVCVECGENAHCDDNPLPVCGPDNTCIACVADEECDTEVCLYDGTCAAPGTVIYTAHDGPASGPCEVDTPCDLRYAVELVLSATRNVIKLGPGSHDITAALDPRDFDMTLIGRGADIVYTGAGNDNVLEFGSPSPVADPHVQVYYVRLTGGRGPFTQGSGIRCSDGSRLTAREVRIDGNDAAGINALSGCTADISEATLFNNDLGSIVLNVGQVTVTDSTIRNSGGVDSTPEEWAGVVVIDGSLDIRRSIIRGNTFGGLDLAEGPHVVENCLIIGNGSNNSEVGGIRFGFDSGHTFRFNTVVNNDNESGTSTGVLCGTPFRGSGNLFHDNTVAASCAQDFSLFTDSALPAPPGDNQVTGVTDPMFASTDPANPMYYHLGPQSPAVNAAQTILDVTDDVDREIRPSSGNPASDIGADEVP